MTGSSDDPDSVGTDERVFLRDVKPYAIVDHLEQLRGPVGGVIELTHSVLWSPGGTSVDLDEPGGRGLAYRAVLAEGTVDDLEQVLNRDQLIAVWPDLLLPHRVRVLWETRFPQLSTIVTTTDSEPN